MKYTYQISFNGSDYFDLTQSGVQMQGAFIEGTKIFRESISELKITKRKNETTYNTLESWWDDSSKFETRIFIKVLKNDVEDSLHWFGIKWGKINKNTGTYIVEPTTYDFWGQYFEANKNVNLYHGLIISTDTFYFFDTTSPYTYVARYVDAVTIEDVIKTIIPSASDGDFDGDDIVSSFMWQDNYESGSSVGEYNGMGLDYVTGEQSYLTKAGILITKDHSLIDVLTWLELFRVYCFFDSNDKLRFEHVKFFNDKLEDNAVDFSDYIDLSDDVWSYDNTSIPNLECVSMSSNEDANEDFIPLDITYSSVRNRIDIEPADFTSSLFSDIGEVGTSDTGDLTVLGSSGNMVYEFIGATISDGNTFDASLSSGSYFGSNDIYLSNGRAVSLTVNLSYIGIGDTISVYFEDRSGNLRSNKISINSTGETTGTLTATATTTDAFLKVEAILGASVVTGWITAEYEGEFMIPTIEGVISETVQTNGAMSIANIIDKWWRDDRISKSATIGGDSYTVDNTQYNLRREDIRIHYSDVINPLYGFNDGDRIGQIEKWTRDLDTDYYTISVIYQEDE